MLASRPALEALGDIVGNGDGGALDLVTQAAIPAEGWKRGELVNSPGELQAGLPNGKILKSFVGHAGRSTVISNLKFEI